MAGAVTVRVLSGCCGGLLLHIDRGLSNLRGVIGPMLTAVAAIACTAGVWPRCTALLFCQETPATCAASAARTYIAALQSTSGIKWYRAY